MAEGNDEAELASGKLSDLAKVPAKDFEKHFREWMERDDVARSLQAKLRYDLVTNFNKTSLGRHIIAQTTMTTGGSYGLTLSPLILALNTLVAEFLYAENCHFALSIFCTEVPYRNTLPNFEQSSPFRFTCAEVHEICEALSPTQVSDFLKTQIAQKYAQAASNVPLLLIVVRSLVDRMRTNTGGTKNVQVEQPMRTVSVRRSRPVSTAYTSSRLRQRYNAKNSLLVSKLRKLNRYVGTLVQQVDEVPKKNTSHLKSCVINMTEQLRQISTGKQYNQQVNSLQSSIMMLVQQIEAHAAKAVEPSTINGNYAHKSTNTSEAKTDGEKSYGDWVHELRGTRNGQKFLGRIENSLRKALNNQKVDLMAETDRKMEQQKAMLKIHYRQKLLDHLARESQADQVMTSRCHDDLEQQLKNLQIQYGNLLQRIENNDKQHEGANNMTPAKYLETTNILQETESARRTSKIKKSKKHCSKYNEEDHSRDQMDELLLSEPVVKNLVNEAKLRLLELENESNELETNLSHLFDKHRKDKRNETQDVLTTWQQSYESITQKPKHSSMDVVPCQPIMNNEEELEDELLREAKMAQLQNSISNKIAMERLEDLDVPYKPKLNAIAAAKKDIFENLSVTRYQLTPPTVRKKTETSSVEIAAERINEQIIPKLSTFLENANSNNQAKELTNETIVMASHQEIVEVQNAQILQKSTEKLNKLFASTKESTTFSSPDNSNEPDNNKNLINSKTFITHEQNQS